MPVVLESASALDNVIGTVPKLFELAGTCLTACVENPILVIFFAAAIGKLGFGMIKSMRRAVSR